MKVVLLMLMFITPTHPDPHFEHGFGPRIVDTLDECIAMRDRLQVYMDKYVGKGVYAQAACVEADVKGYDEAERLLKEKAGSKL